MPNDIQQSALDYLARGWSVVPVRAREKRPLLSWQIYQQRHPAAADVRAWFARWPEANVAIVTGAVSGLVVVDVDRRHGGEQSLARLEREHGPLPRTVKAAPRLRHPALLHLLHPWSRAHPCARGIRTSCSSKNAQPAPASTSPRAC